MIDVENLVVDTITKAVQTEYSGVYVTSEYTNSPSSFPCVSVVEADNYTYKKTQDDCLKEHHAQVMYEVNVFSNKAKGARTEAKKIMNLVDDTFQNIKFTRTFKNEVPNHDKTIFRIVARFEAIIAKGEEIGNNTVFQVYRK